MRVIISLKPQEQHHFY